MEASNHDAYSSCYGLNSPTRWLRTSKGSKQKPKQNSAETIFSPSLFDLLPIEILATILTSLYPLDLVALSMCSKSWETKAWCFTNSLDVLPFYLSSAHGSSPWRPKPLEFRSQLSHRLLAPGVTRVDVARMPHEASSHSHRRRTESRNGTSSPLKHSSSSIKSTGEELPLSASGLMPKRKKSLNDGDLALSSKSVTSPSTRSRKSHLSSSASDLPSASSYELSASPPGSNYTKLLEVPAQSSHHSQSPPESSSMWKTSSSPPLATQSPLSAPTSPREKAQLWKTSNFMQIILARLPVENLLEISLAGCPISHRVFKRIAATGCRSTLLALNLEGCVGNSASCMGYIAKLTNLQYLNLRGCDGMGDSSLRYLRTMTNLKYLDLKDILRIKHSSLPLLQSRHYVGAHSPSSPTSESSSLRSSMGGIPGSPTSNILSSNDKIGTKLLHSMLHHIEPDSGTESEEEIDELTMALSAGGAASPSIISSLHQPDMLPSQYQTHQNRRAEIPLEWYTPTNSIYEAVSRLPNLTALYVSEWNSSSASESHMLTSLVNLKSLHMQYSMCLKDLAPKLPSLEHLSLATRTYANYYVQGAHFAGCSLSNLTAINFTNCYRMNDAGLVIVVEAAPNLVDLRLCFCDAISDSTLTDTLPKLSESLRVLDLRHVDNLTEAGLVQLSRLSNLQSLNLRHISGLQSATCFALSSLFKLQALDLSYCSNLTSEGVAMLSPCSGLKWLALRGVKLVELKAVKSLLSITQSLGLIDLQECPLITSALNATKHGWREFRKVLPTSLLHCFVSNTLTD